jgi:hypothetical protein
MQNTMVTESKPLIAIDDLPIKIKAPQGTSAAEREQLLTIDDLSAYKQKILAKKILITVIVINVIVLISIVLCN